MFRHILFLDIFFSGLGGQVISSHESLYADVFLFIISYQMLHHSFTDCSVSLLSIYNIKSYTLKYQNCFPLNFDVKYLLIPMNNDFSSFL